MPSAARTKTEPEMSWDWYDLLLPIDIKAGTTSATFKVLPLDNTISTKDYTLNFWAGFSSNGCFTGNETYSLIIKDDE